MLFKPRVVECAPAGLVGIPLLRADQLQGAASSSSSSGSSAPSGSSSAAIRRPSLPARNICSPAAIAAPSAQFGVRAVAPVEAQNMHDREPGRPESGTQFRHLRQGRAGTRYLEVLPVEGIDLHVHGNEGCTLEFGPDPVRFLHGVPELLSLYGALICQYAGREWGNSVRRPSAGRALCGGGQPALRLPRQNRLPLATGSL